MMRVGLGPNQNQAIRPVQLMMQCDVISETATQLNEGRADDQHCKAEQTAHMLKTSLETLRDTRLLQKLPKLFACCQVWLGVHVVLN